MTPHVCSSTGWGMASIIKCSHSLLTSLTTICHKWLDCHLMRESYWVATRHQRLCLLNHMENKWPSGVLFLVSMVNMCSKWIWCMETPITYHMYLFGMVGYAVIFRVTSVAKWHHSTCFFKFISFDMKLSHFKPRWKILLANHNFSHLLFISIYVSFRKTV